MGLSHVQLQGARLQPPGRLVLKKWGRELPHDKGHSM